MMTESQLLKPTEPQQETPLVTPKPASVYTEEPKGPAEGIKQIAKETTESPNQQSTRHVAKPKTSSLRKQSAYIFLLFFHLLFL